MTRNVIVSGGGTGIGRAVAHRFAADGDQVVLIGRRSEVLEKAAAEIAAATSAPTPLTCVADLADAEAAERVAAEVAQLLGQVQVLVAAAGGNAALVAQGGQIDGVAGAAWHWTENFRINALTAVLLTEAVRPHLADGARILLVSSIAAYRGSGSGSYAGAKAALHPYAYDLAAELGERGITVNVVAPGYIAGTEFFQGKLSSDRERMLIDQTYTARPGTPVDVAGTVYWLASPTAGQITAQIIQVNGGAERGR
ncbi:MAG: SDR family oxidoreductase [Actinobacteria bacterium]|nr:SDR family oxidoreductase [Actinomycetota bacterium]